jgi:hypothetical protein
MRVGIQVEIGMGRFVVHSMAPRVIGSPVDINIQEGKVAISFCLHGELNALVDTVQVVKEVLSLSGPCGQMTKVSST